MKNKNFIWKAILWVIQGCIIGIGAILPGVSGGTLCYVFGIYDQLLEVLSNPFKGIKKYWLMLVFVGLGAGIGFVGFVHSHIDNDILSYADLNFAKNILVSNGINEIYMGVLNMKIGAITYYCVCFVGTEK